MPIPYGAGYTAPLADGIYPQPDNVPPRVVIAIADPGSTQAWVYRADDTGEVPVLGANPLTLDSTGAGQVCDYASQFGVATVYTVVTS